MVAGVKALAADWKYDAVAIGYPGQVRDGRIMTEPHNLGRGWVGFDFKSAFGCPVRIMNDAAMQALGSYKRGLLLFLGLGTGLGAALVADGVVIPDGAGSPVIQERHLRGLPRRPGPAATGPEEVAEVCRVRDGADD